MTRRIERIVDAVVWGALYLLYGFCYMLYPFALAVFWVWDRLRGGR